MKRLAILFTMVLLLLGAAGCQNKDGGSASTTTNPAKPANPSGFYLSFTVTHNAETADTFESDVYCHDPATGKTEKIATVPYTAQYPLTAYDRGEGLVYYSSKGKKGQNFGDQLFSYNPRTKETKQLTEGIFAINYIIPLGNRQVFLGEAPLSAPVLAVRPFLYHTDTGKLKDLTWDSDLTFTIFNYNPVERSLSGAAFSASDQWQKIADQLETPRVDSVNHVFLWEGLKARELFTVPENVTSLFEDGSAITYSPGKQEHLRYSLKDGKAAAYPLPAKVEETLKTLIYMTPDATTIYYLGYEDGTTLCRYDAQTDSVTVIFAADITKEELNNAVALSA